jgi:hypothetical protein
MMNRALNDWFSGITESLSATIAFYSITDHRPISDISQTSEAQFYAHYFFLYIMHKLIDLKYKLQNRFH